MPFLFAIGGFFLGFLIAGFETAIGGLIVGLGGGVVWSLWQRRTKASQFIEQQEKIDLHLELLGRITELHKTVDGLHERLSRLESEGVSQASSFIAQDAATAKDIGISKTKEAEPSEVFDPVSSKLEPTQISSDIAKAHEVKSELQDIIAETSADDELVEETAPIELIEETSPVESVKTKPSRTVYVPKVPEKSYADDTSPNDVGQRILSFLTGGNTLARVGVVLLIIGLGFLAQIAAREGFFPLELRLAAVALTGVVLCIIGWRLRDKRRTYALSLQGGGVGIMYLTVFASLQLYQLLPASLAFVLLALIAVLSAILAVLQNAQGLAVLGAIGGFSAPFFASSDSGGSHIVLFSYYLILNIGILLIAWFKAWRPLNVLGFLSTFIFGSLWGGLSYKPEFFATTEPFLILFFLLYLAVGLLYALRQEPKFGKFIDGTLTFGLPIIAFSIQATLVRGFEFGLAISSFVLALIYLSLAWLLFFRAPKHLKLLSEVFLAIGLGFATMTIPFALDASWTSVGWALEGVGLVWVGVRLHRLWMRLSGVALQFAAMAALALSTILSLFFSEASVWQFVLNATLIAAAALLSAYFIQKHPDHMRPWEHFFSPVLMVVGLLWWSVAGSVACTRLSSDTASIAISLLLVFFSLTAVACVLLSQRLNWAALKFPALALLPVLLFIYVLIAAVLESGLTALTASTLPSPQSSGLDAGESYLGVALISLLLFPLASVVYLWILQRCKDVVPWLLRFCYAAMLWLISIFFATELRYIFARLTDGQGHWGLVASGLAAIAALLLLSAPRIRKLAWLREQSSNLLTLGLAPIAVLLWLWAFAVNVQVTGAADPLPFVPLLNPLDIVQALALMALIVYVWQLRREGLLGKDARRMVTWLLIILGILWPSASIARTVHHWLGVPFEFAALFDSNVLQTSLSIFWTVFALMSMLLATRRGWRTPWLVGAGLLGIVVLKLVFIELANVEAVARVISFVGVGALLLLIGYIAPIPPSAKLESPPNSEPEGNIVGDNVGEDKQS